MLFTKGTLDHVKGEKEKPPLNTCIFARSGLSAYPPTNVPK